MIIIIDQSIVIIQAILMFIMLGMPIGTLVAIIIDISIVTIRIPIFLNKDKLITKRPLASRDVRFLPSLTARAWPRLIVWEFVVFVGFRK